MKFRVALHSAVLLGFQLLGQQRPVVVVDSHNVLVERFMGLGAQLDPYEYPPSPAAWQLTRQRLDYMRPAFFRVMWRADAYWLGFDDAGNPKYVWDGDEDTAKKRLDPLFAILDYAQSRKIDVMLGEWDPPKALTPRDPRWARMITAFVNYLTTRKQYSVIKYYNYMNEPNGNWMWPEGKVDYAAWAEGMRNLRSEFDTHGLKSLPIAGPDNSGDWDWIDRCAHDLTPQIGLWDMHWYVKDQELLQGEITKLLTAKREMLLKADPGALAKGLYMAEAGIITGRMNGDQQPRVKDFVYGVLMADFVSQVASAGWMGASAWDLDDAMHVVNGRPHPAVPDYLTLKIWGFWNSQGAKMGHPEDEAVRPWFYTWSLMSRLFPKGARIVGNHDQSGVRVMAATGTGATTIMLVNDRDEPQSLTVRVPGEGKRSLDTYHYFEHDRPQDRDGYPVASEVIEKADLDVGVPVALPARGVIFLTTVHEQR